MTRRFLLLVVLIAGTVPGQGHAAGRCVAGVLEELPSWVVDGEQENGQFGYAVATAGDVNDDGFSDLLVGAPSYSAGRGNEGQALLFLGSAEGLATAPVWSVVGEQAGSRLGHSVTVAGDVNGDGYADIVVTSPGYRTGEEAVGRAYLYLGSTVGPSIIPDWTAEGDSAYASFGVSASTAGDVNGDGFSDLVVGASGPGYRGGAFAFLGSASGLSESPVWTARCDQNDAGFGTSVSTAGDINGDGFADLIVGAPDYSSQGENRQGRVFLYVGSASGPSAAPEWRVDGDQVDARFGESVVIAGDVNGDGFTDVAVAAPLHSNNGEREGAVFLYVGSDVGLSTTPSWTGEGGQEGAEFGSGISTAGDVNGDGLADLIVGADGFTDDEVEEGRAVLYLGSTFGLSEAPVWTADGDQDSTRFGASVATAGDVDGDGLSDVVVGAPAYGNGRGRVAVYLGSGATLSTIFDWAKELNDTYAFFGWSVSTAGDVNGDGYSDVIIGAYRYEQFYDWQGRADVYHGSPSGLSQNYAWRVVGENQDDHFGSAVSYAGDVNGDGYSDVIVGAEWRGWPGSDEGKAYLYYGSPSGLSQSAGWTHVEHGYFGTAASDAGDVNGDGFGDFVVGAPTANGKGRAYLFHGSATGPGTVADWYAEGEQAWAGFGTSVATAGDVNGDGFSDVIVGSPIHYCVDLPCRGRAYLYHGSESGLADTAAWVFKADEDYTGLGISVETAGDVNGDGFTDVLVGRDGYNEETYDEYSGAYLFLGSASGLSDLPAWSIENVNDWSGFGRSVALAGDVDGDGYGDVIIGAPQDDRAYVFHGSASGLCEADSWYGQSSGKFGYSVSTAGDVNGDGFDDIVAGAPWYSDGNSFEGRAYVYLGNDRADSNDGIVLLPRQSRILSGPIDLLGCSDSPSSFRILARGRTPAGRGRVRLEWNVAEFGFPLSDAPRTAGGWLDTGVPGPEGSAVEADEIVEGLSGETLYHWRVRVAGDSPFFPHSAWLTMPTTVPAMRHLRTGPVPTGMDTLEEPVDLPRLLTVCANPFASHASIVYVLARAAPVLLEVYDLGGRRIVTLVDVPQEAGRSTIRWDCRDKTGFPVAAGVYLAVLRVGDQTRMAKLVLIR